MSEKSAELACEDGSVFSVVNGTGTTTDRSKCGMNSLLFLSALCNDIIIVTLQQYYMPVWNIYFKFISKKRHKTCVRFLVCHCLFFLAFLLPIFFLGSQVPSRYTVCCRNKDMPGLPSWNIPRARWPINMQDMSHWLLHSWIQSKQFHVLQK